MMTDFGGTRAVSGEAVYRTYQGVQNFLEVDETERVQLKTNSKASIFERQSSSTGRWLFKKIKSIFIKPKPKPKQKDKVVKAPVLPPIPPPPRPAPADGG